MARTITLQGSLEYEQALKKFYEKERGLEQMHKLVKHATLKSGRMYKESHIDRKQK